mmetsp:Transcript_30374/g.83240  ORF Transcript_30374/g.83240 Transcript_30374/m.83240 type:complete len:223 (+) Transcript_30374:88-756(+)
MSTPSTHVDISAERRLTARTREEDINTDDSGLHSDGIGGRHMRRGLRWFWSWVPHRAVYANHLKISLRQRSTTGSMVLHRFPAASKSRVITVAICPSNSIACTRDRSRGIVRAASMPEVSLADAHSPAARSESRALAGRMPTVPPGRTLRSNARTVITSARSTAAVFSSRSERTSRQPLWSSPRSSRCSSAKVHSSASSRMGRNTAREMSAAFMAATILPLR